MSILSSPKDKPKISKSTTFTPMKSIFAYYNENIEAYSLRAAYLRKQIHLMGSIRLALVVAAVAAFWFCRAADWPVLVGIGCLLIFPFAALMFYHTRLFAQKNYYEALEALNKAEYNGLNYDFSAFDGAIDKMSADHSFSLDLDLFGEQSIFQSINRTVTHGGREMLAEWFMHPLTDKEAIQNRQDAIRELVTYTDLRQHFYVTGQRKPGKQNDAHILSALTEGKNYFLNNRFWKVLLLGVPFLWVVIPAACVLGLLNWSLASIWFCVCFLVGYSPITKVNELHNKVNKMERIFHIYANLMKSIEKQSFNSSELQTISHQLTGEKGQTASQAIKQLSRYIGGLDQRGSFIGVLLNIFYLRDIRHALLLERWKKEQAAHIPQWLEALARFDAFSSLATFDFNHPAYTYADISDTYFELEGKGLGHPLLHRDVCIKNDIALTRHPSFLIITGANMAGKSTYLRTVGVNYLLACIGAPACADSLRVYPASLVTSLRTSDSLISNESYFFSELKRLKMIIDRLQAGEELFIILDEILKGTNSVDKQKGSIALMRQLISCRTCGIIATHDLLLGSLEQEFPDEVKNFRFEADIKNEELSFSYLLREGVAQNMNACFLMKKMGIVVS